MTTVIYRAEPLGATWAQLIEWYGLPQHKERRVRVYGGVAGGGKAFRNSTFGKRTPPAMRGVTWVAIDEEAK